MPSDNKKRRDQKKKEAAKTREQNKGKQTKGQENQNGDEFPPSKNGNGIENGDQIEEELTLEEALVKKLEKDMDLNAESRACTGVLGVHPRSRDIKIDNLSITFHGAEILTDTKLELNCGRRYGLIGLNGCGKSTLLSCLGRREVPIQQVRR